MFLLSSVTNTLSTQVYALQVLRGGDITHSTNRYSLMWHRGSRLEIISPRLLARVVSFSIIQGGTLLKCLEGGKKQKLPLQQQQAGTSCWTDSKQESLRWLLEPPRGILPSGTSSWDRQQLLLILISPESAEIHPGSWVWRQSKDAGMEPEHIHIPLWVNVETLQSIGTREDWPHQRREARCRMDAWKTGFSRIQAMSPVQFSVSALSFLSFSSFSFILEYHWLAMLCSS